MEDLIPIVALMLPVFIVGIVFYFGSRNRKAVLDTVSEAAKAGQVLDPATIRALGMPQKNTGNGDLKAGAILIAVAAGFITLGWAISTVDSGDAAEAFPIMTAVASFPGFIGIVLLGFGLAKKKDSEAG